MKFGKSVAVTGALALSLTMLTQAQAVEPDQLQQEIDSVLAKTEGGAQISRNEIAWEGGKVTMTFPLPGEEVAPPASPAAVALQAKISGVSSSKLNKAVKSGVGLAAADNCPTETFGNDWYCFYQYKNFGGRRLAWNEGKPGGWYFSAYDFTNTTSSWSNKGGMPIYVWGRKKTGDDTSCLKSLWIESEHTKDAQVAANVDNQADCFRTGL
ncbi:peptidase inhibitor family I36 protein [Streptomyces sp. 21So2-11]|uniref:peptidase inhibitor family I36 protein n=1 Tax=Streptomyces sp. 21So2-11 TaxID=3144408 RepID=UPI003219CA17